MAFLCRSALRARPVFAAAVAARSAMVAPAAVAWRPFPSRSFAEFMQHRDTPDNNASTPFEWTPASLERIDTVLKRYPAQYKRAATIPLLWIAQEQNDNFLTLAAMNKIAETLDVPAIKVYETATFYTMFNRTKRGKYHIQLCGTTPCQLHGAAELKSFLLDYLGVAEGETTKDGLFTVHEVECLGACVNAPMLQVNNEFYYEHLNLDNLKNLVDTFKKGETPKPYNQNHIKNCEGPLGKTSLFNELDYFQPFRDLDKLKADMEAAKKAAAEEQ